ncbi:OLC1v1024590C1 [Oldenlandia corymbosa var. corymbosa]|uniref:OLC1v1024590C1 n=1 Tax=Oldenlandia corymbosa var. corymbosa TaxID=529605 RepID=A0AAV1C557_OLDCO|nr:OLC1v1024590C1 [Oldenlandia corymbosa var. corymbosa]
MSTGESETVSVSVEAPEKYCAAWNHQETNGFEAIKDDWIDKGKEKIKEFAKDLKKFEKYSRIVKWDAVQHFVPAVPVKEKEVNNTLDTPVKEKKDEEMSTTKAMGVQKKKKKRVMKDSEKEPKKRSKTDIPITKSAAQGEKTIPPVIERARVAEESGPSKKPSAMDKCKGPLEGEATIMPSHLFEGGPTMAVHTFGEPPIIDYPLLEELIAQLTETDSVRLIMAIEEVNMAATQYRGHGVAVAGLKRLKGNRPIKAKWFKQFLRENLKKIMHEALVKVLTKLRVKQVPLWEALCGSLAKMSTPEDITTFPGDSATILSKGPSEEQPIPDVPDEYIGIELEDDDDEASKEGETGNSGAKGDDPPAEDATGRAKKNDPPTKGASENRPSHEADSWPVHRINLMILSGEQSKDLYSMISNIMRRRADIHIIEIVMSPEADILDAIRAHNVRVSQHLIDEIKGLREETHQRDYQKD